jgi:protocatechuate 3,4-dioxygenase, alpha subunit
VGVTPFQTVGPFLHLGLRAGLHETEGMVSEAPSITVAGRLIDGHGHGVPDGVLEVWWADGSGRYGGDAAQSFQRVFTDPSGGFTIAAFRPGSVEGLDGLRQSPHLAVLVLGRGILTCYFTRIYFADDHTLDTDPILQHVPGERRDTLIARPLGDGRYHLDVILQGENETVFFDV